MTASALDLTLFQAIRIDPTASPELETVAEFAAAWGILVVPVVLVALWLSGAKSARLAGVVGAMSASLALTVAGMISWTFYAPRPFTEGLSANVLHHVADSSFPSDHLAVLGAVTAALALGGLYRAASVVGLAALGVGWARIGLGIHFPSDILGGFVVGGIAALCFQTAALRRFADFVTTIAEALLGRLRYDRLAGRIHLLTTKGH